MSDPRKSDTDEQKFLGLRRRVWFIIVAAAVIGALAIGPTGRQNLVIEREARRACGEGNVAEITATGFTCAGAHGEQ